MTSLPDDQAVLVIAPGGVPWVMTLAELPAEDRALLRLRQRPDRAAVLALAAVMIDEMAFD